MIVNLELGVFFIACNRMWTNLFTFIVRRPFVYPSQINACWCVPCGGQALASCLYVETRWPMPSSSTAWRQQQMEISTTEKIPDASTSRFQTCTIAQGIDKLFAPWSLLQITTLKGPKSQWGLEKESGTSASPVITLITPGDTKLGFTQAGSWLRTPGRLTRSSVSQTKPHFSSNMF